MILAKIIKEKLIAKIFWEGKPTGKHLHSTNGDLMYSFSIRQFIWEYIGFFFEGKFPYAFVFN